MFARVGRAASPDVIRGVATAIVVAITAADVTQLFVSPVNPRQRYVALYHGPPDTGCAVGGRG